MIIGIAGSFGAGKGTVVDYLISNRNFIHYSASGFITQEIIKRKMPVNRDSMRVVANELRKEYGPTYIVDTLYKKASEQGGDAIIESLRALAEVRKVKELGGVVLGVDAEPLLRYERSKKRGSVKDDVTYEKWLLQEKTESDTEDETKQNIFGALSEADYVIENNGTLQELYAQIEEVLQKIER